MPTVTFVETMRGQVVLTQPGAAEHLTAPLSTPLDEDAATIAAHLQQGMQQGQAHPMCWQDLAIAVQNQPTLSENGLAGVIEAGKIVVGGLSAAPLVIEQGDFYLLPATPAGERRMRYHLVCQSQAGQRYLLYGFKRIAKRPGRFLPRAIWQDTTTLFVTIYALDVQDMPATLAATGVIHIQLLDFLRQLLTMRSRQAGGVFAKLRNLTSFGRFFVTGVLAAYGS